MSRSQRPRKPYQPRPVAQALPKDARQDIEIMAYFMIPKLADGKFDDADANTLAYLLNLARAIAVQRGNSDIIALADRAMAAWLPVRQRNDRIGKWGAAGAEYTALKETVPPLAQYMLRQPLHVVDEARKFVLEVNKKMMAAGVVFADVDGHGRLSNEVGAALRRSHRPCARRR